MAVRDEGHKKVDAEAQEENPSNREKYECSKLEPSEIPPVREILSLGNGVVEKRAIAGSMTGTLRMSVSPAGLTSHELKNKDPSDIWDHQLLRGVEAEHVSDNSRTQRLRIVDLFAGCGGLSLGMRMAADALGVRAVNLAAADTNKSALGVYKRNFRPRHAYSDNLWQAIDFQVSHLSNRTRFVSTPKIMVPELRYLSGSVDILLGGPPCQGHSSLNNRTRQNDPRNVMYLAMPAFAAALRVGAVIIENVPQIIHDRSGVVDISVRLFESLGYGVATEIINVLDLGIPQTRRRHILIATLGAQPELAKVVRSLQSSERPVNWAIDDLVDFKGDSNFDSPATLSEENQTRIRYLFENAEYNLPDEIRPKSHRNGHTYPSVYGRLHWDRPAGTITTGFLTPGRGRYVHPLRQRTLTAHEAARIQGFPDSFQFRLEDDTIPFLSHLASMIGEAVPPKLGYVAGLCALAALS